MEIEILTNKENNRIHNGEFEVRYNNELIITGRIFEYHNRNVKHSISFCCECNVEKALFLKCCEKIHNKFSDKGKNTIYTHGGERNGSSKSRK